MKIVEPSHWILSPPDGHRRLAPQLLELAGRTCYKSEAKITSESAWRFVRGLIENGHESVIEHFNITVKFICDRGVSHELVRHRLASYSQESTRYCDYKGEVVFVKPPFWEGDPLSFEAWRQACNKAEMSYRYRRKNGCPPEQARSVLPNSLKTEIVVTANLREWRHIFKLRTSKRAHPQMREIMVPLLKQLAEEIPCVFGDILTTPEE